MANPVIKKTGDFQGSINSLGGGGRFKQMVASGKSPALAAFIGSKMYGKKKMATMSAKGRTKAPAVTASTPKISMPPKGIAVGNPNAMRTS